MSGLFLYLTMAKRRKKKSTRRITTFLFVLFFGMSAFFIYLHYFNNKVKPVVISELPGLPEGFVCYGIDISHHQGKVDWDAFFNNSDSTIRFIYCKVTEGESLKDREWKNNHARLSQEKIPHGGYHFFRPSVSAVAQANHFLREYDYSKTSLPPVLDVEVDAQSDAILIENMKVWLNLVERATGKRPVIYTSYSFYSKKFKEHFSNYKFWVANYSDHAHRFRDERIIHWQFSETGTIPGIKGFVDLNYSKINF